ncbi:SGNH hydrolase-type esterase domain [Trinorchestia longiramus]|nr:SGNH hydrolase-type esterase domain [Trinorchestia longiramus]
MEECRFCYFKQESAAIIEKQSRTIQELSRQLELNRQLKLGRHLEFNRQINLLAERLATIETNQKQHYEHELRLKSPETQLEQHLLNKNQPQHIKIIAKRSNFYLKTKNRFNALKYEMENNINSTKEQTTQISNEQNPQQIPSHTQPAGILEPIRKSNKITNINMQNFDGNKCTTNEKTKNKKRPHVFLTGNSIIQGQKTEFKQGLDEHKILCRPKIRLPEAVHLAEDLRCRKEDTVIVICGTQELEHETQDEIFLQFKALIHKVKNKSKNAIITSILPRRKDVNLNPQILLTNEKVKEICAGKGVMYLDLMSHYTGQNYLFKKDGIPLNKVGQAKLGSLLTISTLGLTATLEDKIDNVQNSTGILKIYPEHQQGKEEKNSDNCNSTNTELNDPRRHRKAVKTRLKTRTTEDTGWQRTKPPTKNVGTSSHCVNVAIAVNEAWLDLNGRHQPAEVSVKGYVLHNVDKPSHSNRDGDSLIYIKETLQQQIEIKRATEKSEILHLKIQPIGSNLMNTNSLQQHVNEPTRGNNILDLVMTTTDPV